MDTDEKIILKKALTKFFKFDSFKSDEQYEATLAVLKKNSDILINLPPASGKSICIQLPTMLLLGKITIVIAPNNESLENQVEFLLKFGINICYFTSKVSLDNRIEIMEKIISRELDVKFIYITITMFVKDWFKNFITALNTQNLISMIVVDKAHCVSERCIDYNQLYVEVGKIRNTCPSIKFIAMTSIGTESINLDIKKFLQLKNPLEISHIQWRRPNVYIQVKFKEILDNPFEDMEELIRNFMNFMKDFSGIIFCRRIQEIALVVQQLNQLDIPTVPYFLKMKDSEKKKNKEKWMSGRVTMIVTTHDSGIVLNKSSVACIIHWSLPLTLEQYYREIGRGGRNNEKTLCRIYFGLEDWMNIQITALSMPIVLSKEFENMIQYCVSDECRHLMYSRYFGIGIAPCDEVCDICDGNIFFKKSLDKFRIIHNQRKLLPKISQLPLTEVYNQPKTVKFVKNVKEESRLNYYRRLANTLIKNYENTNCVNKQDMETSNICRLARNLEYLQFSTSYNVNYYSSKMMDMRDSILKSTEQFRKFFLSHIFY